MTINLLVIVINIGGSPRLDKGIGDAIYYILKSCTESIKDNLLIVFTKAEC